MREVTENMIERLQSEVGGSTAHRKRLGRSDGFFSPAAVFFPLARLIICKKTCRLLWIVSTTVIEFRR